VKFDHVAFEVCVWTDRHTYRHTNRNTLHPYRSKVKITVLKLRRSNFINIEKYTIFMTSKENLYALNDVNRGKFTKITNSVYL